MTEQIRMCDKCPDEPAVALFQWEWGETGACSQKGQMLLQQLAKNLKRNIFFTPLAVAPAPMTRDERHRLIAAKLAAESEATEVSERSAKLYAQNQELRTEVNRAKVMQAEADAQIQDLKEDLEEMAKIRDQYARDAGKLIAELESANILLEAGPKQAEQQLAEVSRELEKAKARIVELEQSLQPGQ